MTTITLQDGTELSEKDLADHFSIRVPNLHTWGDVHNMIANVVSTRNAHQMRDRMNPHHPTHHKEQERIHVELRSLLAIAKCKNFFLNATNKPETAEQQNAYDCIKRCMDDDFNREVDAMLSDTASAAGATYGDQSK